MYSDPYIKYIIPYIKMHFGKLKIPVCYQYLALSEFYILDI